MARRRTLNYREFRSYDDDDEHRDEEVDEEEDEDSDDEVEAEEGDEDSDEEEEAPPTRKKKAAKEPKAKRSRATKNVRMKVVWAVFDNSNKRIQEFPYAQKHQADELAAKLATDKKQTFFVQPVKVPMEEKG